ncbi:MAG: rhomboid family intramembrane serine protease [Bacteroidales bacterium]|nr:rhomboid family intramembrane serine protease [Bacteroidales bacterium]
MSYYDQQPYERRPMIPVVTRNILIVNAIFFIATLVNENFMVSTFGLFYPASQYFRWWQPLTHMFMHGGFWHLFFNMYTLFIFGMAVERTIGERKFLLFYFICGLGAAALHMGVQALQAASLMNQMADGVSKAAALYAQLKLTPTVGASGAIYGVLLGYAFLYPENRMTLLFPPVTLSAKWMVLIFLGIELLTGVTGTLDGVAHFAHLGGALFAWLLMTCWKKSGSLYNQSWW